METSSPSFPCFVCSRCAFPICTSHDIIHETIPGGTTTQAFTYQLEDLLELEHSVPCYSVTDEINTTINLSEELFDLPAHPLARMLLLGTSVATETPHVEQTAVNSALPLNSHDNVFTTSSETESLLQQEQEQEWETNEEEQREMETTSLVQETRSESNNITRNNSDTHNGNNNSSSTLTLPVSLGFNNTAHKRIDLIGVRTAIVNTSLMPCRAHITEKNIEQEQNVGHRTHRKSKQEKEIASKVSTTNNLELSSSSSASSQQEVAVSHVPADVITAAYEAFCPTRWNSPVGGNYTVRETNMEITRSTASSQKQWFNLYSIAERLECADCHYPLAYLFKRSHTKPELTNSSNHKMQPTHDLELLKPEPLTEIGTIENKQCNSKEENANLATKTTASGAASEEEYEEEEYKEFVGLELKRIKEIHWTVNDFWERYSKANSLLSFRSMFPEAETLQSMLSRLTALRVQCELYNRLLSKHKQQHDVQNVLLQSHSDRIEMYEAKLKPLQELTSALKARLSVQEMQMSNQEALLHTHRLQIDTQSKQMAVQQMLITQLGKTINNQEDKIQLLETQLASKVHDTCNSESENEEIPTVCTTVNRFDKLPLLHHNTDNPHRHGNKTNSNTSNNTGLHKSEQGTEIDNLLETNAYALDKCSTTEQNLCDINNNNNSESNNYYYKNRYSRATRLYHDVNDNNSIIIGDNRNNISNNRVESKLRSHLRSTSKTMLCNVPPKHLAGVTPMKHFTQTENKSLDNKYSNSSNKEYVNTSNNNIRHQRQNDDSDEEK